MLCLTPEAIAQRKAPGRTTPGGQPRYSDLSDIAHHLPDPPAPGRVYSAGLVCPFRRGPGQWMEEKHGEDTAVVIPLRSTVIAEGTTGLPDQRNRRPARIQEKERLDWQAATDYGKRALVESMIACFKMLTGIRLRARTFVG